MREEDKAISYGIENEKWYALFYEGAIVDAIYIDHNRYKRASEMTEEEYEQLAEWVARGMLKDKAME